ncbi:GumC family protein [Xanthovirga aplysinae]|uniref:GumC family protein n=1 Tax=Xanthovirga aplysinae TaxID=2529853 RepID=UPI0012BC1200|nr:tyrosine-protein kinase [Xanthovirga aplysinae]MTI30687.1 polysaccharide biosynthesis tyrosine autokinase [Xanthovirga aplysinae]
MEKQKYDIAADRDKQHQSLASDPLSVLDIDKAFSVVRSSLPWILLIILFTNLSAYLIIRYTPPLYESSTELKLAVKDEGVSMLGFNALTESPTYDNLSGEIELINSKLLFNKVIDSLGLDVTYRTDYGNILNEERYGNSPFRVDFGLKNPAFYDKEFSIKILNEREYKLNYLFGEQLFSEEHTFGKAFSNKHFKLNIHLTSNFSKELTGNNSFVFIINSRDALIKYIASSIKVVPLNLNAKTIRITFSDRNKYKAKEIVSAIAHIYLDYTSEEKNKANKSKIKFLDEQLDQTAQKLEYYEKYFENFTIENKTLDLNQNINKAITQLEKLDSQRFQINHNIGQYRKLKNLIEKDSSGSKTLSFYDDLQPDIRQKLQDLNEVLESKKILLGAYNENTYAVQKKELEAELYKKELLTYLQEYENGVVKQLEELKNQKEYFQENLFQLPAKGTAYNKAQRRYGLYESFFLSMMQKKAEFEIAQAGTLTDFVILSPANLAGAPVSPNKLLIHGIGGLAGILFSFLFIAVRYLLHHSISTVNELERLVMSPLLGVIPFYRGSKKEHSELIIARNPKSIVSESLRSIRTNMEFLRTKSHKKIISITSTVGGEGKTFVAVNLGGILGLANQKIIILDLDMRQPKVHLAFNDPISQEGMSTLLIGKSTIKDCIRSTSVKNLDYIPAGPTPPNPSELLLNEEFDHLLNKLKETYDIIILDTPPIGLVADGILVMQKADLPIYIVRANYSKKSFVKTLNRLIEVNGFKNISIIFNSVKTGKANYYGYYGYDNSHIEGYPGVGGPGKKILKKFNLLKK